ncbi:acetyltransferase, GNAT family [Candidatus Moduliflexus flocculans]|uniref:Acetyltransferase, GNAT family n=1 Tax=Candidatus Moduliflexus flocculans TaxID=1499966 RepID=A0A0S6W6G6_9BACT|nr:acetyltransferase, GNAT family [Candidatus Moduliflexus flocculans]
MQLAMIKTLQDVEQCVELYIEVFNAAPWNDEWTTATASQRLSDIYHSPGFLGIACHVDDRLVGCLLGNIEQYYTGPYFFLKEMCVRTALQRQGIGQQLFERLYQQLQQDQMTSILLFTAKDFFPYTFYQKHGFHEVNGMRMMKKDW